LVFDTTALRQIGFALPYAPIQAWYEAEEFCPTPGADGVVDLFLDQPVKSSGAIGVDVLVCANAAVIGHFKQGVPG
jgi:hypothetical protein